MLPTTFPFLPSSADAKEREPSPVRRRHCLLHPREAYFVDPCLDIALPIVVDEAFRDDFISAQVQPTSFAERNPAPVTETFMQAAVVSAMLILWTTQESILRKVLQVFKRYTVQAFFIT